MKTLFTVHAGEYLVGSYIEKHFRDLSLWLPSKDTGIDLLLTSRTRTRAVSLQVKYSKDFNVSHEPIVVSKVLAAGWWSLDRKKILSSHADFWVFVLTSFLEYKTSYVIVPRNELVERFTRIFGTARRVDSYLWVTKSGACWETRGLKKSEKEMLVFGRAPNESRNFSRYLNQWDQLRKKLK